MNKRLPSRSGISTARTAAKLPTWPGVNLPSLAPNQGSRVSVCKNTGLSIPECSCGPCLRAQLEEHMPALRERRERSTQSGPSASQTGRSGGQRRAA